MKTLFFLQDVSKNEGEVFYWVIGIIFLACVLYMVVGVFVVYQIAYRRPRKQNKWLKEKYPENSN